MTGPKWLARTASLLVLGLFVVQCSSALAQETNIAGKQFMVARYTNQPPVIDGVFTPQEWHRAIPVHVDGSTPATAPGVVPNIGLPFLFPPDSPADSSFTIYTLYDDNYLYIAVDVRDDIVVCDGPVPYLDDDVEVMIDGDRQPGDVHMAYACGPGNPDCPNPVVNNEGFKLTTSACGDTLTDPQNNPSLVGSRRLARARTDSSSNIECRSIPSIPSTPAGSRLSFRPRVFAVRSLATSSDSTSPWGMMTTVVWAICGQNLRRTRIALQRGMGGVLAGTYSLSRTGGICCWSREIGEESWPPTLRGARWVSDYFKASQVSVHRTDANLGHRAISKTRERCVRESEFRPSDQFQSQHQYILVGGREVETD